jgi:hypothetical protein
MSPDANGAAGFAASIESVLKTTAVSTKAEVSYRAGQFQVCGTLAEVRKALPMILTSDAVKNTTATVQVQFELSRGELRFQSGLLEFGRHGDGCLPF